VTGTDGSHREPPRVESINVAGFRARLVPGRAVLLAAPIGSYLGPGDHTVGGVTAVDISLDHTARCQATKRHRPRAARDPGTAPRGGRSRSVFP
jgi:hypothetical protein